MSTSLDVLDMPPPKTHISLLMTTARVSPVALGMFAIAVQVLATGSYLKESSLSVKSTKPPLV
jgi:hypothetical protein